MKTTNKKSNGMLLAFLSFLLVIALVSLAAWFLIKPVPEVLQGEMDASEVHVASKIPGRIVHFMVEEGTQVQKGDTLALLSSPELDAKLQQAESAEQAAYAQELKAKKGARKEQIDGAYELWQKAEVGVSLSKKTFDRVQNMFTDGVVSQQKRDEAEAGYQAALATAKAAKSQYDMVLNGAEREDKMAAAALVGRAKGAVSEVEAYVAETALIAPISGMVNEIYPNEGELVGPGAPVVSLVNKDDTWAVFNIREDKLASLKTGSVLTAIVPALSNREIVFKVDYIKAMAGYATWKPTKSNDGFDLKTFEVHARPVSGATELLPGMSVVVTGRANGHNSVR